MDVKIGSMCEDDLREVDDKIVGLVFWMFLLDMQPPVVFKLHGS